MENIISESAMDKLYNLSVSAQLETDFFNEEMYGTEVVEQNRMLESVYQFMYKLDVLGIPLNFFLILPDIHGRLLIMLADGKFLPEIMEKLDLNVSDLLTMGQKILELLDQYSPHLEKDEIKMIELFIHDFIIGEIQLNNI